MHTNDISPQAQVRIAELELELQQTRDQLQQVTARADGLRDSEEKYRVLTEQMTAMTGMIQGDHFIFANPGLTQTLGYSSEELAQIPFIDLIHPDERPVIVDRAQRRARGEAVPERYVCKVVTKSGDTRWVDLSLSQFTYQGIPTLIGTGFDITDRIRVEAALRESEAKFHLLSETAPAAIMIFQRGQLLYANAYLARDTGYTPEELAQLPLTEIVHPDDRNLMVDHARRLAQHTDASDRFIFRGITKAGTMRWLDCSMTNIVYGGQTAQLAVFFNITERKQIEEALHESEKRFRNFFERNHAVMLFVDPESGNILDANPAACTYYGYPLGQLTSMHLSEINEMTPNEATTLMQQTLARDYHFFPCRHRLASGEIRDVDTYRGPFILDEKSLIYIIVHDVTERKRFDRELEHERAFLHTALDMLPQPILFTDPQGAYILLNASARKWMQQLGIGGGTQAQLLDPQLHTAIPREQWPESRALRGEVVNAEEYLLTVADGQYRQPILLTAVPIRLEQEIVAAVSIFEDVSRLKEADRAKDEFLALLSHELQTPLAGVLGWSELALDQLDPTKMVDALGHVQRNARQLQQLIDELLDMSRIIHRKMSITPVLADLRLLAREALDNILCEADKRQLNLAVETSSEPLPVQVDPTRMQQCLGNLLRNSLKFTPAGGQVTIACRRDAQEAILTVRDTGCGIPPERYSHLFDPFYQLNRDEYRNGLGLGLAITRGIVEQHGGRIWADSPGEGQGCTVSIAFPLCVEAMPADVPAAPAGKTQKARQAPETPGNFTQPVPEESARILVVDDASDLRAIACTMLERAGFRTLQAENGVDALAMLEAQSVDLVILDISMPGMDGREVCRQIKHHPHTRHLPVLILTARNLPLEREISLNVAKADGFLVKPIDRANLINAVKKALGR